jgi:hypothetical protein
VGSDVFTVAIMSMLITARIRAFSAAGSVLTYCLLPKEALFLASKQNEPEIVACFAPRQNGSDLERAGRSTRVVIGVR